MQLFRWSLFFLCVAFAVPAWADAHSCGLPVAIDPAIRFPHAATGPLDILALGSGSMLGPDGDEANSIASLMVDRLRAGLPHRVIGLRLLGQRGQTAVAMLAALRTELAGRHVALVLWQTGTVEAIRRIPLTGFKATVAEGLRAIRDAGADVMLVDPQYSRHLGERVDVRPYRAALREAGREAGAPVFDRYGLMRGWAEAGRLDLDGTSRKDRSATLARVQACLADALAANVMAGVTR